MVLKSRPERNIVRIRFALSSITTYDVDDWRADGYHWRQGGSHAVTVNGVVVRAKYFSAYTEPNKWTSEFRRTVSDRHDAVLLKYDGNEASISTSVVLVPSYSVLLPSYGS